MTPRALLLKNGLTQLNTVRLVNTAHPKPAVHNAKSMSHFSKQAQSTYQRPFHKKTALTSRYVNQKLNTAMRYYHTERPRAVNTARSCTTPVNAVRAKRGKPQQDDTMLGLKRLQGFLLLLKYIMEIMLSICAAGYKDTTAAELQLLECRSLLTGSE
ncbi:hypothetical protein Tco_0075143 [Tanacetum coccineum]